MKMRRSWGLLAGVRPKPIGGPSATEHHGRIGGRLGRLTPISASLLACLVPALLAGCGGGASKPTASAAASAKPSAAIASAAAASPTAAPTPGSAAEGSYTVKPGDTLSSIATANKTTTDAIMRANNLSDPDKLQVGQRLVIPSAQAEASASASGAASAAASGALPSAASKPPPP